MSQPRHASSWAAKHPLLLALFIVAAVAIPGALLLQHENTKTNHALAGVSGAADSASAAAKGAASAASRAAELAQANHELVHCIRRVEIANARRDNALRVARRAVDDAEKNVSIARARLFRDVLTLNTPRKQRQFRRDLRADLRLHRVWLRRVSHYEAVQRHYPIPSKPKFPCLNRLAIPPPQSSPSQTPHASNVHTTTEVTTAPGAVTTVTIPGTTVVIRQVPKTITVTRTVTTTVPPGKAKVTITATTTVPPGHCHPHPC